MNESKTCPRCGEHKPAAAFGTRVVDGRTYLRSLCKPCVLARQRDVRATPEGREAARADTRKRRSDPAVYARHLASWRTRYHTNEDFRQAQLEKSHEVLARNSVRVRRIRALLDHFEGRGGWIARIAEAVMRRPDAAGLQWLCPRIEQACAELVGDF